MGAPEHCWDLWLFANRVVFFLVPKTGMFAELHQTAFTKF